VSVNVGRTTSEEIAAHYAASAPRRQAARDFDGLELGGLELRGTGDAGCPRLAAYGQARRRRKWQGGGKGKVAQKARRRRDVAQTLQRLPADDRLRDPHPVTRTFQLALAAREVQASVSPTPSVVDPGVIPTDRTAILHFAISHLMSPGRT
jgi:hypothetical protein